MSSRRRADRGDEEREALHVIPVDVGDERGAAEGAVLGLGLAEEAQTSAEVEMMVSPATSRKLDTCAVLPP